MIWTVLMWAGGISVGGVVISQVYCWITDRPNPVWEVLGDILEGLGDVVGAIGDVIGDSDGGDSGD